MEDGHRLVALGPRQSARITSGPLSPTFTLFILSQASLSLCLSLSLSVSLRHHVLCLPLASVSLSLSGITLSVSLWHHSLSLSGITISLPPTHTLFRFPSEPQHSNIKIVFTPPSEILHAPTTFMLPVHPNNLQRSA